MPCINADGTISRSAELLLPTCHTTVTCEDLAREVKLPLYRIRRASRELAADGRPAAVGDKFLTTDKGNQAQEGSTEV
jgi:hypothetical protein